MVKLFPREKNFEAYIATSAEQAQTANMLHNARWRLGEEKSWHLDQANGQLLLNFDDGSFALAPAQIVGTYHHQDSSFLWAWDHPSILPALQRNATAVKQFGKKHGARELTKSKLKCTEHRAWELTALTMHLNQAKGAYRVLIKPGVSMFLTFGDVQIAHEKQS